MDAKGNVILYTAGDLAATMSLNVDLKVLSANGYYDSVTPFFQTTLDLQNMPLADAAVRKNLTIRYYPSGHMIYLDGGSRTALKADLARLYDSATADRGAMARILSLQKAASSGKGSLDDRAALRSDCRPIAARVRKRLAGVTGQRSAGCRPTGHSVVLGADDQNGEDQ